jgi:hypothetical protein
VTDPKWHATLSLPPRNRIAMDPTWRSSNPTVPGGRSSAFAAKGAAASERVTVVTGGAGAIGDALNADGRGVVVVAWWSLTAAAAATLHAVAALSWTS